MSAHPTRNRKCIHPEPERLHLRDEQTPDGAYVRVFDCAVCGPYEIALDVDDLEHVARLQLQFLGQLIAIPEEKVAEIRAQRYADARSHTSGEGGGSD